ncbi:histidine kinase [Paenibacillus macerans]|uniref:histidine kinase n=1 Tax=Paenibacillus macerans TaxID=44252 RepID=UPI00353138C7
MNPHFLYNTLQSIQWEAELNRQAKIAQMVKALGMLLRRSTSTQEHLTTLREEMEMLDAYLMIQKYRYETITAKSRRSWPISSPVSGGGAMADAKPNSPLCVLLICLLSRISGFVIAEANFTPTANNTTSSSAKTPINPVRIAWMVLKMLLYGTRFT